MRMMFKLVALAVLGLFFQLTFEATAAVTGFPCNFPEASFTEEQSRAVVAAQQRFDNSSRLARWVIIDVLDMPYLPATSL